MGNLSGALGSATRSLAAFSQALSVIQNNIANAATPGYARQRVAFSPVVTPSGLTLGVEVRQVQSLRDNLLDFQVLLGRQSTSLFAKQQQIFQQIEPIFDLSGERNINGEVDKLFSAFAALSVSPGDFNLRRGVLDAAGAVVDSVQSTFTSLSRQSASLESEARSTVGRINGLLEQVAELAALGTNSKTGQNFAADTRLNQILDELSGLINFTLIHQSDGALTLVTGGGETLVVGTTVRRLAVSVTEPAIAILDEDGRDITAGIESQGGSLGAILELRNQKLPDYLNQVSRIAKAVADRVNEQHALGVDVTGAAGAAIFDYQTSFVLGSGRTAGTAGAATPAPPVSVDVTFSGGVTGSISATLDSFFVASAAPSGVSAGDTISVTFTSADGEIERTITTSALLGGESTADLVTRLNDQIAVDPELAGHITFSGSGGNIKLVLSETAGQGFSFSSTTSNPGFTTGLESGGVLGGHSAAEIVAALNAQIALDPALSGAGIRFVDVAGEVKLDGDVSFNYTVTDNDPATAGFASGLAGSGSAGGAVAANSLRLAGLSAAKIAAGAPGFPGGNENALALAALANTGIVNGVTHTEAFAALVSEVGQASAAASSQLDTQNQILATAQGLRDSFSGVDINEEAVKILEFERAFQASTRVIQVINSLMDEILDLVR